MKTILTAALLASAPAAHSAMQTAAQTAPQSPAAAQTPVTVEYYYRIKWGAAVDFKRL